MIIILIPIAFVAGMVFMAMLVAGRTPPPSPDELGERIDIAVADAQMERIAQKTAWEKPDTCPLMQDSMARIWRDVAEAANR